MDKKQWLLPAALLFCAAAAALSLLLGAVRLSPAQLWQALAGGPNNTAGYIFWYARLPRTLACLLSGAALAVSGAVIQAVLSNKLASPGIIGVNAGAGLAVTVCCVLGLLSGWTIALSAFGGAMISVLLVVFTAEKTGASRTTVILGGVAVNSFLGALSEALTSLVPDAGVLSGDFRVGGFSSVVPVRLMPAGILICAALIIILTLHNDLDVLALGEETARSLGMPVRKMRTLFLILSAMLAGASVSFAGLLGFVGLIVPHAVRSLVGSESRKMLPLCAIGGAGFVTACDLAARLVFIPYELPVGILMSVLGGPFFLCLLAKRKGGRAHA
jgi:iron complex transport system permease protein